MNNRKILNKIKEHYPSRSVISSKIGWPNDLNSTHLKMWAGRLRQKGHDNKETSRIIIQHFEKIKNDATSEECWLTICRAIEACHEFDKEGNIHQLLTLVNRTFLPFKHWVGNNYPQHSCQHLAKSMKAVIDRHYAGCGKSIMGRPTNDYLIPMKKTSVNNSLKYNAATRDKLAAGFWSPGSRAVLVKDINELIKKNVFGKDADNPKNVILEFGMK